ncbi:GNAT family N-acetyltransferase [Solitalea longa]|uniref:GNAT family N-acetyltransferase n=1 Tax=Solitalea longa TaxID=2079460 RepID=A0A2S4ZXF0_9SPHI|nr:GNAT family N-acetyltransferase [Solitalea longa]POY35040.1 GNAT family N-acetyltransferase [Solitalea longa]
MKIKRITADEVLNIRREVLYPDRAIHEIKLPEDDHGLHYGLFIDAELISVVSLFITGKSAQFRKFATIAKYQGKGYGSYLLNYIIAEAENHGCELIWCNARLSAVKFYLKFGFTETEERFTKDNVAFVIMEYLIS